MNLNKTICLLALSLTFGTQAYAAVGTAGDTALDSKVDAVDQSSLESKQAENKLKKENALTINQFRLMLEESDFAGLNKLIEDNNVIGDVAIQDVLQSNSNRYDIRAMLLLSKLYANYYNGISQDSLNYFALAFITYDMQADMATEQEKIKMYKNQFFKGFEEQLDAIKRDDHIRSGALNFVKDFYSPITDNKSVTSNKVLEMSKLTTNSQWLVKFFNEGHRAQLFKEMNINEKTDIVKRVLDHFLYNKKEE